MPHAALALLLLAAPGDALVPGESPRTARRLGEIADKEKEARAKPSEQRWAEVVGELQAVLGSAGDDLVPAGDGDRLVPARWVCHARLAGLPPTALRLYRGRVEEQARKWLEQAKQDRDASVLRRVVEEAFCSRAAESALDLLGDLAFECGDFDEARRWWARLLTAEKGALPPAYPDPQGDPAAIRAKDLVAHWFGGGQAAPTEWRRALAEFRTKYPWAVGHLAGARGL